MIDLGLGLARGTALHPCWLSGERTPANVDEALDALREVSRQLRQRRDNRAIFPDVYGIITEKVAQEIHEPTGLFWEPSFIARLAGCFAERYLDALRSALDDAPQDCEAWAIAYGCNDVEGLAPLQHAALGISAHINFDLALGIHRTIVELGASKNTLLIRRFKHDHDQVNRILAASFRPALERMIDAYGCRTSNLIAHLSLGFAQRTTLATLTHWRERVWDNVLALLNCRGSAERQQLRQQMDRAAGRTGRLLAMTSAGKLLSRLTRLPGTDRLLSRARPHA